MHYKQIHDNIIQKAQSECRKKLQRNHPDYVYFERHHITPKCLGGSNDKENLVLLTAREHFIIHKLLVEIYPDEKGLQYALWNMCSKGNKYQVRGYRISSREYERLRKIHSINVSNNLTGFKHSEETKKKMKENLPDRSGEKNPFFGKRHSEETKEINRQTHLGGRYTEETLNKFRDGNRKGKNNANYGNHLSEGAKLKIKEANIKYQESYGNTFSGKVHLIASKNKMKDSWSKRSVIVCPWCNKSSKNKGVMGRYHFSNCEQNPNSKREFVKCPHCGKVGLKVGANMKRYHFDNCKHKNNQENEN